MLRPLTLPVLDTWHPSSKRACSSRLSCQLAKQRFVSPSLATATHISLFWARVVSHDARLSGSSSRPGGFEWQGRLCWDWGILLRSCHLLSLLLGQSQEAQESWAKGKTLNTDHPPLYREFAYPCSPQLVCCLNLRNSYFVTVLDL